MKFLTKICILLFLFIPIVLHAYHGKGFRIVSEKLILSHQSTGGVKPRIKKRDPMPDDFPGRSLTTTLDASGHINEEVEVYAVHNILIKNITNQIQRFQYSQTLNCHGREIKNIRWVEVEPGGLFEDETETYLILRENETGKHLIKASTELVGLYNAYTESYGTLIAYP